MPIKKTSFKDTDQPLPDHEPLASGGGSQGSEDCCVCDNPNTTWCNPESPKGAGSLATDWGGTFIALITGR